MVGYHEHYYLEWSALMLKYNTDNEFRNTVAKIGRAFFIFFLPESSWWFRRPPGPCLLPLTNNRSRVQGCKQMAHQKTWIKLGI